MSVWIAEHVEGVSLATAVTKKGGGGRPLLGQRLPAVGHKIMFTAR